MQIEMSEENLNNYIDRLQAGSSSRTTAVWQQGGLDATILQMAANLNSLKPGANVANGGFVSRLRERVLAEAAPGGDPTR